MKKRIALILTVLFTVAALPIAPAFQSAAAEGMTEKPYYLIDEHFAFIRGKEWPVMAAKPSGWDVKSAGGELTSAYNTWFKIADKTNLLPVELSKWFKAENDGVFGFEYRFKFVKLMEETTWKVRMDDKDGVSFIVKNGNLCIETGGETKVLEPISEQKEYGIRADFDLSAKKIDVYVNGALKAEGVSFKENISQINNVQIKTGVEATGEMFLNPVKLYKNFIVNEKFMTAIDGARPADWQMDSSGGTAETFKTLSSTEPDVYSLKLNDTSASGAVTASKSFARQTGPLSFEFKTLFNQKIDGVSGGIYSGDNLVFAVVTQGGKLCYTGADGSAVPVDDYITRLWYSFRITMDFQAKKATLWVNGRKVAVDVDLPALADSVDNIKFTTGKEGTGEVWVDDFILGANPPLPADYVPVPQPVYPDEPYNVGIQSCSMWREGHHLGWDFISGWPDRKPLLGFYDEGNPEVSDWEIKFLVENGINFEIYSWFRSNAGDAPVKDPYGADYAIHQGYFYSEYSEMLKYMFYWENGGMGPAKNSKDFRENIVPFWIEYYFKDPRYFRIDDKPVLAILTMSGLERDFGTDPDKIKAELDYLRKACRDAGVGEILLITNTGSSNKATLEKIKRVGFDAIYMYNWGLSSKVIDTQMNSLKAQQAAGIIDIIPNVNMGFDVTAWGTNLGLGGYVKVEEFPTLVSWAKNEFMPNEPEGSLGRNTLVFANLNEYGEGHFMAPSGLAGFGYLEGVRSVFAPGRSADNVLPSEAAMERMSRLYSVDRYVAPPVLPQPPPSDIVEKGWYFDTDGDFEGWDQTRDGDMAYKKLEDLKVSGGMLSAKALGSDPGIIIENFTGVELSDIPYIKLKTKISFNGAGGQIYFITEADQNWDEAKCIRFTSEGKANEVNETLIYTLNNKNWVGKLKALRIDPFDQAIGETFAFDSIEFLREGRAEGIRVLMDGEQQRYEQPPIILSDRVMVPLRAIFEALGANVDWDGPTRTVTSFKNGKLVELTIGDKTAYIDRKPVELDQPAEIVNDRTLVPIRFVSEAFGATVDWVEAERTVLIDTTTAAAAEAPDGPNLITGGNMEGSISAFKSWEAELSLDKKEFFEGKQSLKVAASEEFGCAKFPVAMASNTEYYFSAWVKLGGDVKNSSILQVVTEYVESGEMVQKIVINSLPLSQDKWTFVSGTFTISASSSVSDTLILAFIGSPSAAGVFYLDDVKVIKVGSSSAPEAKPQTPEPTKAPDKPAQSDDGPLPIDKSEAVARKNNLVKDPGFEGKKFDYSSWGVDLSMTKETAYSGAQSLKAVKSEDYGSIKFPLDLKPGVEYEISAWFKNGAGAAGTRVHCVLEYTFGGEKFEKIIITLDSLNEAGWAQLKGSYMIDSKEKISDASLIFFSDGPPSAGDVYYLDDIIVAPAA